MINKNLLKSTTLKYVIKIISLTISNVVKVLTEYSMFINSFHLETFLGSSTSKSTAFSYEIMENKSLQIKWHSFGTNYFIQIIFNLIEHTRTEKFTQ